MASSKIEYERLFTDFKKVQNVVQLLNCNFTLKPNGEWANEGTNVSKYDKASLKMKITEFQENYDLKNLYNENNLKIESDSTYDKFLLKYVAENKYLNINKIK